MESIFIGLVRSQQRRGTALVLLLIGAIVFAVITAAVKALGPAFPANAAAYFFVIDHRYSPLSPAMVAFAVYGREYFWIPLVALMWLFGKGNVKFSAYVMVIAFVLSIVVGEALKAILAVPRPFVYYPYIQTLIPRPSDFSYPSGHALITFAGASSTYLYLRRRYSALLTLEAVLVSYSRVYVGVHWPFDVIGGAVLGFTLAMIASYVAEEDHFLRLYRFLAARITVVKP